MFAPPVVEQYDSLNFTVTVYAIHDDLLFEGDVFHYTQIAANPLGTNAPNQISFSIYPTPASGILTITTQTNITQIRIYDYLGQLLLSNSHQNEIDISKLSPGLYFCEIKDGKGNSGVKKVVKE